MLYFTIIYHSNSFTLVFNGECYKSYMSIYFSSTPLELDPKKVVDGH